MTVDSEKLVAFILDKSNNDKEYILDIRKITEISEIERKIERLLDELKENNVIQEYTKKNKNCFSVIIEKDATLKGTMPKHAVQQAEKSSQNVETIPVGALWNTIGQRDLIHERVLGQFIKKRYQNFVGDESIFQEYSNLFKLFVQVSDDESREQEIDHLFQFVLDKIDEINDENYIKILGPDGTGKSTFLSILYVYLYKCFRERRLAQYPFYINLHYYDSAVTEADSITELDKKVEEKMNEDLKELIEISKENDKAGFLIIIDGRDKYYRSQLSSGNILDKIVSQIKGHKKIICLGEKTNVYPFKDRKEGNNLDFRTAYIFRFSPINIYKKATWEDAVEKYCKIINRVNEIRHMRDCIERFKIKEVDYNLFSILEKCSKRCKLSEVESISDLYGRYCMNYLENSQNRLKVSIDLAYEYFMTDIMIEQRYISENWKEWELIHQHKAISNYLLALYYAEFILKCKSENVKRFDCVFTNGINVFLKAILNEKKSSQDSAISFCRMMFQKGGYKAQAQAAYLVGRINGDDNDENLREEAQEILAEQLRILEDRKKKELNTDKIDGKRLIEKERELHFLCRSILVSMLKLGDEGAGEKLLDTFFRSPIMNEVNRAFYLQYYDDVRLEPKRVNLRDKGKDSMLYTSGVLLNYIYRQLQEPETTWTPMEVYDFQVHLFTLCSLVQVRLHQGIDEDILGKLRDVISLTLKNVKNRLNKEMRYYLQMLQEDIIGKAFDVSHLYNELYELKSIQRRGWTEKIKAGSIKMDSNRKKADAFLYENVVEHTYYAWLLGMLYLPETFSLEGTYNNLGDKEYNYSKYDKRKILDCILIHDLAETYLGDKLPDEKTERHKKKEIDCMRRIFMHDMYDGIAKMDEYRAGWKSFSSMSDDINGKIAKEIDIIQAIYQFCVYKRMGAEFEEEKEKEWREEKEKIETHIGFNILNEVVLKNFKDIFTESNLDAETKKD